MRLLTLLAVCFTVTFTHAQDNIILRSGQEIPAKVLEVSSTGLTYRKSANPDGPIYSAPLRDVLLIKYANGTKDSFGIGQTPAPNNGPEQTIESPDDKMGAMSGLDRLRYRRGLFSRYYMGTNGQRIDMPEARSVLYGQPGALSAFERGQSLRTWSLVTAVPAIALIGAGVGMAVAGHHGPNGRFGPLRLPDPDPNGIGNRNGYGGRERRDGAVVGATLAGGVLLGVTSVWLSHRATVQFRRAADRYSHRTPTSLQLIPSQQSAGIGAVFTF